MVEGEINKDQLIKELEEHINREKLGAFIGAGLSIPAGFCDWKDLLKEPAKELNLNIEKENDLVSLAQYYSNKNKRTAIDNLIKRQFDKIVEPTENHNLLAQLPIKTFWTTNYDKLIEDSLRKNMKQPDIKRTDHDLRSTNFNYDAVVYKLHGDVSNANDVVITRSDYEEYGYEKRKLFRDVLEGDLLIRPFLFLGFSFSDSNFNYVVSRLRVLLGDENIPRHYCIMKKISDKEEDAEYKKIRQELQIKDLNRYGIYTHLVFEHKEITDILKILVDKYRRKTVYISGSTESYGEYSDEEGQDFIHKLAFKLVENGFRIVNGYGKGVGEFILNGVGEYCLKSEKIKIKDVLTIMPFPQKISSGINLVELYKKNREQMIETCGIAIFLFGDKKNATIATGVIDEYNIAKSKELVCLPINHTGGASHQIYDEVMKYYNTEEILEAIRESNKYENRDLLSNIDHIMNAIKMLNKEEY